MKRIYQYFALTSLSGLLCLFLAIPANAQRGGHQGGGGGGSTAGGGGGGGRSGGGGGGGFSGGGGSSMSRSSGGGFQGNRGGGEMSRPSQQPSVASRPDQGRNQIFGGNRATNSAPATQSYRGGTYGNQPTVASRAQGYNQGNRYSYGSRPGYNGGVTQAYRARPGYGNSGYNRGTSSYYRNGRYYGNSYNRPYYGNRYGNNRYYGVFGRYNGYHYNRGFYSSLYYPRLGFNLSILPYGYYPFYWGDSRYYYSDGYYYQQYNNQYTVVEPPIGAAINTLPSKAESIVINGEQYYELNGVYYRAVVQDNGNTVYEIAGKDGQLDTGNIDDMAGPTIDEPQIGDIVSDLPEDTRKVKLAGQSFFVSPDDFYYQETRDASGRKAYKVVGTPNDEPGNQ